MQDIDKFSEAKMSAMYFVCFRESLPENLRSKFVKSLKGFENPTDDVIHGYKGPERLRIPGSSYSEAEGEYYGIQRIGFWYGVSKTMNYAPIVGQILWAGRKIKESSTWTNDWRYLYFNAATGEMIEEHEAEKIEQKNRLAEEYYQKGEKHSQSGHYGDAFHAFENAFYHCTTGYTNQLKFKKAMDETLPKKVKQLYEEADCLVIDKSYDQALELYKEVDKIVKEPETKRSCRDKQARVFMAKAEDAKADGFLEDAERNYKEALKITTDETLKRQIRELMASNDVVEEGPSMNQETESRLKSSELIIEGLDLICQGNLLAMDNELQVASVKYDQVEKLFEEALTLHPHDAIFRSFLKLIDSYLKIQDHIKADNLIEKVRSLFPDKSGWFDQVKEDLQEADTYSVNNSKRLDEKKSLEESKIVQNLHY